MAIKDTFYSLVPINWLLRITALSNIYRKGNEIYTFGSMIKRVIYICVLAIVNLLFLYLKLNKKEMKLQGPLRFTNLIQMAYWLPYLVFVIDLYFAQKYSGDVLLKFIKNFDNIDETLGKCDYDEIRGTIVTSTALSICSFIFVCLFEYFSWFLIEGWEDPAIYSIDYLYWFLNMLTILDLVSHIVQVEFRLKNIQIQLQVSLPFNIKNEVNTH